MLISLFRAIACARRADLEAVLGTALAQTVEDFFRRKNTV
jgi:hypothetical protein